MNPHFAKIAIIATSFAMPLLAADEVATTEAAVATKETASLTLKNIIVNGGAFMYVLGALSIMAVMLVLFFLFTLRKNRLCPVNFLHQAQDAADAADPEALLEACNAAGDQPGAKTLAAAANALITDGNADSKSLKQAVEEEGSRQIGALWNRLQYLEVIGTIAPMVGLLGTVWGMMVSFTGLEAGTSIVNKADRLASGVSQAMYTTFGGLIVAIVAIFAHALFRGHLNQLSGEMENACAEVLRRLETARRKQSAKSTDEKK